MIEEKLLELKKKRIEKLAKKSLMEKRMDSLEKRLDTLQASVSLVERKLEKVEKLLRTLNLTEIITQLMDLLSLIDSKIDELKEKLRS